ncbi:MAG: polymer-forming cytoskeletal protein [Planctomycetota bacterium]
MAESDSQTTVIGADSYFKGEMSFERTAKIIGRFDGKISGKGELQIGQQATCKADIESNVANIDGTIEGNVTAKDTVKLTANGKVKGDITATKMTMAEGASFYGMCAVGGDAGKGSSGGGNAGGAPQGGQSQGGQPSKK